MRMEDVNASTATSTSTSTTSTSSSSSSSSTDNHNNTKRASVLLHAPVVGDVSFGSSWERRWQTLAMFSCSLYFIIPSVFGMWALTLWCLFGTHNSGTSTSIGSIASLLMRGSSSSSAVAAAAAASTEQTTAMTTTLNPSWLTVLVALYLGFAFVLDKSPTAGTRPPLLRTFPFQKWWQYSCDYLPLLLVKTADLPTDQGQRYVLGYHPHGIISVGCFGAFATDGARVLDLTTTEAATTTTTKQDQTKKQEDVDDNDDVDDENTAGTGSGPQQQQRGFSSLFPGLDRRVITLPQNFQTPFLREYFLFMGACTSAKETFRTVLKRPQTALVVVVGGAAESLQSAEGSMDLVLESRKGFCREAILAQASLVPVLGFGETDLYKIVQPSDGMAKIQSLFKRMTGFGMPLFQGRSILFQDIGIMPQRKPVVVVVGAPLPPPSWKNKEKGGSFHPEIDRATGKALNDDGKMLNDYHAQYVQALEDLFETYKNAPWNIPGRDRRKSLAIVR